MNYIFNVAKFIASFIILYQSQNYLMFCWTLSVGVTFLSWSVSCVAAQFTCAIQHENTEPFWVLYIYIHKRKWCRVYSSIYHSYHCVCYWVLHKCFRLLSNQQQCRFFLVTFNLDWMTEPRSPSWPQYYKVKKEDFSLNSFTFLMYKL